ncbi:MSH4 [Lepeophtheirus salmonis]|uniref:MSH4 n=1 Tax=Lepeophtheirus salmonis TaxID=72036 RepID=A0A7R8H5Y7_LEPSM|nr:MSH4 [Lepeophtheirus salmonis]CAF2886963.1 MSH4 [Lepeophtheirus salmonis]
MASSQEDINNLTRFRNEISLIRVDEHEESALNSRSTSVNISRFVGLRIGCIIEGRGGAKGEIGIASISTSIPILVLSQITDSASYVKTLSKLIPLDLDELVVPIGLDDGNLLDDINSVLPDTTIPASALLDYLTINMNIFYAPNSVFVEYQGPEDSILIDYDTAKKYRAIETQFNLDLQNMLDDSALKDKKNESYSREFDSEIVNELVEVAERMTKAYDMPIRLKLNSVRGFHLFVVFNKKSPSNPKVETLPSEFILKKSCQNGIIFTTEDTLRLNSKSQEALRVTNLIANKIINKLLEELKTNVSVLHKLSEQLNYIDMILSLSITSGRNIASKNIVPNSIYHNIESNFIVITGPNMSGKSTYLREIILLQILFQIGCFVPADNATFKIMSAIYTRFGTYDNMESNTSTFTREMKDMSYIFSSTENNTASTLVLMDELGRSTNNFEGASLCWAMSEELILRSHVTCFLVTHFKQLPRLENYYPTVTNYHFLKEMGKTFMLVKGINIDEINYGIKFSKECGLCPNIVERAEEILQSMQEEDKLIPLMSEDDMERLNYINLGFLAYKMILDHYQSAEIPQQDIREHFEKLRSQFVDIDEE